MNLNDTIASNQYLTKEIKELTQKLKKRDEELKRMNKENLKIREAYKNLINKKFKIKTT